MSALDPSYIRSIRDGIINGTIEANNQEALPDGLVGLYDKELFPPTMKWKERKETLDFFLVFALAQKEISADFAAEILGDEWYNQADEQTSKEEKRLKKVNDLVQLHSKRLSSAEGGKYRLYHERFRVFVLQKVSEEDIDQFNAKFISLCETALETISEKNIPEKESYALEFISTHYFISAMQGEKECLNKEQAAALKKYAYDQQFWERQVKASKGFEWSKKMLGEMMSWASKFDDEEVIECALNKVDLYHQEQNDAPRIVQLVADGDIETVLARIEKFGGDDKEGLQRKFILYMLCLMELTLLDSKDKDHAKSSIEKILKDLDEQLLVDHSVLNWNDFFPSYLMFQMAIELEKRDQNYLIIFARTEKWESNWIKENGLNSESECNLFFKLIPQIKDATELNKAINNFACELAKQGKIDFALECLQSSENESNKSSILHNISLVLSNKGEIAKSLKIARKIPNNQQNHKSSSLFFIARELAAIGEHEESIKLIMEATDFARCINDNTRRSIALAVISSEHHKQKRKLESSNLIKEAIENTECLSDYSSKSRSLCIIASELFQQGKLIKSSNLMKKALKCAEFIEDSFKKGSIMRFILGQLVKQGRTEKALDYARNMRADYWRVQVLIEISSELNKLEKFNDSLSLIQEAHANAIRLDDYYWRIWAIKDISCELAQQNKIDEAYEYAKGIKNHYFKNIAIKEISNQLSIKEKLFDSFYMLLESTKEIREDDEMKSKALIRIFCEMVNQGKTEVALANAKQIRDFIWRAEALRDISKALAIRELNEEAMKCALDINIEEEKISAILSISSELHKQGKHYRSKLAIKKALKVAKGIRNESERSLALNFVSSELFKQGRIHDVSVTIQELVESILSINDESGRSWRIWRILKAVSSQLAKEERLSEAINCAERISDDYWKSSAFASISSELSNQGKLKKAESNMQIALELARGIVEESHKVDALRAICREQARQGNLTIAEKIGLEIIQIKERHRCWNDIAEINYKQFGWQKALKLVNQLKTSESKLFYLKGLAEYIDLAECSIEIFLNSNHYFLEDVEAIEYILEKLTLNKLFFSEFFPQEKLDRYNRTLNLQWAIDIKNQLPN